jgi:cellulose biosynthesis protein BcsQ
VAREAAAAVSGDRGLVRDGKGKAPEHDWRVIDTPAGLHGEDLREAVRRADVMLVPLTPSAFDMGATRHFLTAIQEHKAIKKGALALGIVAMRVDPRTHSAAELDSFLEAFDFPVVTHLRGHAGLRSFAQGRRLGVRSPSIAWRAGLGAVEAAYALDHAAHLAEGLIANGCRQV